VDENKSNIPDYKKLYENLSKRISRLHQVANSLILYEQFRHVNEQELGRLMKTITNYPLDILH